MVEAKFRTDSQGKVEIKEALYAYACLIDLKKVGIEQGCLATNARFKTDVISHAECCGLKFFFLGIPCRNKPDSTL